MYQIHEGDQLYIEFKINNGDSKDSPLIDISTASAIEFAIDNVFKLWKPDGSGEVKYDETKKNVYVSSNSRRIVYNEKAKPISSTY